jgi:hypothetical protein
MPELVPVQSSNIQALGYLPNTQDLYVRFTVRGRPGSEGPLYKYTNVPAGVFSRFMRSASKGRFFWMHIRKQFRYYMWTGAAWRAMREK